MKVRTGKIFFQALILIIPVMIIFGCGSSSDMDFKSAEEVYNKGVAAFEDEDYLDAKKFFEVIKLQYPASQYADDAQFYLAEINFARGEYILGAFNYSRLRSLYPGSEYVKESIYKAALCYYELSPTFDRDQEYTRKGIEAFNIFQRLYPNDSLFSEAEEKIDALRDKLAHRDYYTAELYRTLEFPHSSLIYYDSVIDNYPDTKYYEQAWIGKIEVLIIFRRLDEASGLIDLFRKNFPESQYLTDLKKLEEQITTIKKN